MCIWRSMLKIRQPQSLLPQKQAFIFTLLGLHVDCSLTIKSWAWLDGFGPDCGLGSGLLYVSPFGPQDEWASTPRAVWDSTKFVMHACVRSHFSCCKLFVILWTVACQASLSMGFSRLEYWSGLPYPSPGDLPNPGIKPASLISPALAGKFFTTLPPGKFSAVWHYSKKTAVHEKMALNRHQIWCCPDVRLPSL